jgi:hypothetical protein
MKILRSVTRRGFSIGTAGYFAILKPNTWFPATRLPRPFRYHPGQSVQAPAETTAAPNIITLPPEHRSPLRLTIIVLASAAIVFCMLLWIMHPNFK